MPCVTSPCAITILPDAEAARIIVNQLPLMLPQWQNGSRIDSHAKADPPRTLYFLPLSPWHLCFASVLLDPLAMSEKQQQASAGLTRNLKARWRNRTLLAPVEEIMGFVKYGRYTFIKYGDRTSTATFC